MKLLERADVIRRIIEVLPVGIWVMDPSGQIQYGNAEGIRIWGGARYVPPSEFGEYVGWWVETGEKIRPEEWAAARAVLKGETSIGEEVEIQCFDGTRKIIRNSALPIKGDDGTIEGAIIVNEDITERKRYERRLQELADRDPLTGAFNRRRLFEMLDEEIERKRRYGLRLSLVMFDLDHFKDVNDRYGHLVGDQVLCAIVESAREELRSVDKLARYGGEEFVVILPGIDAEGAAVVAERLRRCFGELRVDDAPPVTCSFGVCEVKEEADPDAAMRHVDELLYGAKEGGRNRVVTDPDGPPR